MVVDNELMKKVPSLFETWHQKSSMCEFLWDNKNNDSKEILNALRLYDMVRRLYFVKTGEEPDGIAVLEIIKFIESNKELDELIMSYVTTGVFPNATTLKFLKN